MLNFILTICLGWTGYAHFRKGQIGLGILWLFTLGCFCIGWIYDIVEAYKEYRSVSVRKEYQSTNNDVCYDFDVVFVNKGRKVYHCDQMCAMSHSVRAEEMKEKQAVKKGLIRCKKCYGQINNY